MAKKWYPVIDILTCVECGTCVERAGVAGADKGVALALREHFQTDSHGAVLFFADYRQRGILHSYDLGGMDDLYVRAVNVNIFFLCS